MGHLSYQTHIQNVGWIAAVGEGQASGQGSSNRQVEAVRISLVGEISQYYDVYYRVHSQNKGWLGWAKNGSDAGTEGLSLGVEGIEVTLVKKGGSAPGTTVKPFEKKAAVAKGTSVALMSSASQGNYAKVNKIIYLDAGHGGADPGATYAGITEKSLNLKMQSLVRSKLERLGYKVITTRDTDAYLDLLPRSKKANQSIADLFVSIHFNASTSGRANGIETYYYQYYPEYQPAINKTYHNNAERLKRSAVLASAIQTAAVSATGAKDNGVLRETFAVLRETTAPAVLLELGYMSNYAERNRITNSAYQEKLAQAIVSGILSYYKTYSI
ncbi:N-acetylmuramoyl-L-alanine amidase [Streptococcus thoraltensis]|uniref:N-acetylmuramoyl-L-alanine amidase n=1 Tax=Streptococcus thoraltensis TaxID=55085 RepID=UPI003CC7CDEC